MKRLFIFLLLTSLSIGSLSAQTAKAFEKAGDKAFQAKNYSAALEYYREALEMKENKVSLWYKYAEVARLFHSYEIAESYFKRVLNNEKAKDFPLVHFNLAQVYKSTGNYSLASQHFKNYLEQHKNGPFSEDARQEIAICAWAEEITAHPGEEDIQQLNKRVNSAYSEFGPLQRGDTLYYSSFRYDNPNDDYVPSRKISKVLYSIRGAKGRPLKRKFNEKTKLTAHTTFSADGQRIYYTLCEYSGETTIRCDLYYREKDKRKRWGKAVKLPEPVNQKGMTSTHPHVAVHEKDGKEYLYFVSNRPGGAGGLDVWYVEILQKGKFGNPENLKAINTAKDDITPYYHQPSQTLFFSSEGRKGLGGFDIYKTNQTPEGWSEPVHLGHPLNTSYNDLYFILNADSTAGYLSSNRLGAMYLDKDNKTCCNDIYRVLIPQPKEETPPEEPPVLDSLIVEEEPPTLEPKPDAPVVEVPPTTLEDFLPLALYFDNDEPDRRTRRTSTKKSYEQTFFRYYERRFEFREAYTEGLSGEPRILAETEIDDFFRDKVKKGHDYLGLFSDILLKRLDAGERVEIFVKGFTSPRAKSDYNLRLGKRRISSVKNHFKTYRGGVFQNYLQKGKLIITERSFGETTAATGINDDLNNRRLSVFSPEASRERRVEIVEIKRD